MSPKCKHYQRTKPQSRERNRSHDKKNRNKFQMWNCWSKHKHCLATSTTFSLSARHVGSELMSTPSWQTAGFHGDKAIRLSRFLGRMFSFTFTGLMAVRRVQDLSPSQTHSQLKISNFNSSTQTDTALQTDVAPLNASALLTFDAGPDCRSPR